MPWRSMSFIVKTWTPESRTATFSRSSRLRTPTSTVCSGSTFGGTLPIVASSAGSGPSSAASGMPCTLPLGDVAGVFMSPCASTQMQADRQFASSRRAQSAAGRDRAGGRGCDRRRARAASRPRRATPATVCTASGRPCAMSRMYFLCSSRSVLRFGNRRRQVALVDDGVAERGDLLAEAGDAERRRPHVDAAPAAAEVERHADDVDRFQLPTPKSPTPKMGCCRESGSYVTVRRSRPRGRGGAAVGMQSGMPIARKPLPVTNRPGSAGARSMLSDALRGDRLRTAGSGASSDRDARTERSPGDAKQVARARAAQCRSAPSSARRGVRVAAAAEECAQQHVTVGRAARPLRRHPCCRPAARCASTRGTTKPMPRIGCAT